MKLKSIITAAQGRRLIRRARGIVEERNALRAENGQLRRAAELAMQQLELALARKKVS